MERVSAGRGGGGGADRPLGYRPGAEQAHSGGGSSSSSRPIEPEVLGREEWIDQLSWLLDRAIPLGRRFGIGLDALLGLIPGVGDVASGLISSMIIFHAHRAGIPRPTLLRMVANVGIDSVLGAIPFIGDLFDIAWQANTKNLELYRQAIRGERETRKDTGFLLMLLAAVAVIVAVPVVLLIWLAQSFWR
jgi:hypothetical protein